MSRKTETCAFAPAHISGFFTIHLEKDAVRSGSTGCGICLQKGVFVKIVPNETETKCRIRINGAEMDAPTSESVIRQVYDKYGEKKGLPPPSFIIDTDLEVPLGCGFGSSGAGALSTAFALNRALSMDLTVNQIAEMSHIAEVESRTGLGSVAGQIYGGIVIRKKAGSPAFCKIDRIPCAEEEISWASFGGIETKSVLDDKTNFDIINRAGKVAMKALVKKPTIETFMIESKKFALTIGLMSDRAMDAIEAVESAGGLASQAMLGDTVFAINDSCALESLGRGEAGKSRVCCGCARLV